MFPFIGPAIVIDFRRAAVLARLGSSDTPQPFAMALARIAAWCAIGSIAAVLAIPVLAILSAIF